MTPEKKAIEAAWAELLESRKLIQREMLAAITARKDVADGELLRHVKAYRFVTENMRRTAPRVYTALAGYVPVTRMHYLFPKELMS
jgi:hypothetical protein